MVDDVALWFLLAMGVLFIWFGCRMTARDDRPLAPEDHHFGRFDQAA